MTHQWLPAIAITDTTLRESGLNPRGADLVRALDAAGVAAIEVSRELPIPVLTEIACGAETILWGPATKALINLAVRCGIGMVYLSVDLMRGARELERLNRTIRYARDRGLAAGLCGGEASRANFSAVRRVIATAEAAGAVRFRYTDTTGILHPVRTHAIFRQLCAETDLELEFRGHNHYGLATANSVAAVQGGATHITGCLSAQAQGAVDLVATIEAIRGFTSHPVGVDLSRIIPLAPYFRTPAQPFEGLRATAPAGPRLAGVSVPLTSGGR